MTYIYICWWWCWSGGFRGNLFLHKASRFVFGFQRFTETSSKPLFGISSNIGWVWPWIAKNPAFSLQIRIVLKGSHHWKTGTGIALGVYRYTIYIYIFVYRDERERPLFYWVMVCMVCTSPVDLLDKMLKRSRLLPTWPCQKSQGEQGGIIIAMVNSDWIWDLMVI